MPVDAKISAWLATVPNNSTVQFGSGRCYGQDGTITLSGRIGLVIDGQGSEFRYWVFQLANATVKDPAVRQAVAQIIDRDAIAKNAYDETVAPSYSIERDGSLHT